MWLCRSMLINKGKDLVMIARKDGSRMDASSAKQGRGQKVDKNARHGGMRTIKYLRESCYHRIKSSVTNSLTALMMSNT